MENTISVRDLAVTRGTAAFMVCRFRRYANSVVGLHLTDHYERLIRSCHEAGICSGRDVVSFAGLHEEIRSQWPAGLVDGVVRVIVTGGESLDSVNSVQGNERIIVTVDSYKQPSSKPLTLKLVCGKHQLPDVKITGKYAVPKIYRDEARREGFDDILFYSGDDGVTESFSANFFAVFDGYLITPKKDVLHGVTRKIVLDLAKQSGLFKNVVESDFYHFAFYNKSAEAFLTSTTRGIMPVVKISRGVYCRLREFKTGPKTLTARLQTLYNEYVEKYFTQRGQ